MGGGLRREDTEKIYPSYPSPQFNHPGDEDLSATLCLDALVKRKVLAIAFEGHSHKDACPVAGCKGIWMPKGYGGGAAWIYVECVTPRESENAHSILIEIPSLRNGLFKATLLDSLHAIHIGLYVFFAELKVLITNFNIY